MLITSSYYDEIVVYLCFRNELVAAVYAFHEGGPSAIDGEMDRPTGRAFGYFNGWATTRTGGQNDEYCISGRHHGRFDF